MKATSRPNGEAAVLAKIAPMPALYRALCERLHALNLGTAPAIRPSVWYGMPGCAKDGQTVCFFRANKDYVTKREESAPQQLIEPARHFTALNDATGAKLSSIVRKVAISCETRSCT